MITNALTVADTHDAAGWYGKLAMLGDFAQRRLPHDLVQRCDAWMSRAMEGSRQVLGADWLETYLNAPVLRFGLAPGVHDAHWWFGTLMPSCDQVGRYFPLLVVQRRSRAPADGIALDHLELWFEHLTQASLRTLRDGSTLADFEAALHDTPPWPTPAGGAPLVSRPGAALERWRLGPAPSLHQAMNALATQGLLERLAGHSLWWRPADDGLDPTLSLVAGLPDATAFAAMLSGR